jgi:serine protease SohB
MEHVYAYVLFLAKAVTVVAAIVAVAAAVSALAARRGGSSGGHLEVRRLNDRLRDLEHAFASAFLPARELKRRLKGERKADALRQKQAVAEPRRRVFALAFHGDLIASKLDHLRNEVTAVLTTARAEDEVVVRVESSGGMVHAYGLAASQLQRVRAHGLRLVVAVDKVAASGGYMMASVADHIVAAPFAVVGSIGVLAQVPNFNRLLKKHDVDVEVLTAGKYKRTLSVLGENTEAGRAKFVEELEDVHALFQEFVAGNRPQLDVASVATGESWYGRRAIDRKLVDELATSDEYLMRACERADVYEIRWIEHKRPIDRLMGRFADAARSAFTDFRLS